ncbi:longevity assurance proteins LAG1/LAC1 [Artomyces pyxidatus]|uniref:Longevity assurance proteins LAG1/LAC1 n=1 Tax=Artomyces pyxidatus TaxID=48021 RepID=A0ACB8TAU0_9AGAM|nr:longevity assurance proteins LAG1/LAC1 [Artomyces pyxidatus]
MDYILDNKRLPSFLVPFVSLSYPVERPLVTDDSFHDATYYQIGYRDVCLIVTLIAAMAFFRDVARLGLLEPFAKWKLTRDWRIRQGTKALLTNGHDKINGPANEKVEVNGTGKANGKVDGKANGNGLAGEKQLVEPLLDGSPEGRRIRRQVLRFAEQGWQFIYYSLQWSLGLYVYRNIPSDLWIGYPHIPLAGPIKFYYLLQMAFYIHAVLVLNAEARRKDHWQMFTHHVITIALVGLSYSYNTTRVGCVIMVLMDWVDIFLPFAKMLRYLNYQTLCDAAFVWFLISWVVTRHVLFMIVLVYTYLEPPRIGVLGWNPELGIFLTKEAHLVFVVLLCCLQVLQMIWCYTIFSVAYRVVMGHGADDSRSDDEG